MSNGLFGKYNVLIDEGIHVLLSTAVSATGYFLGLNLSFSILCFALGILIDVDHFLNSFLAKKLHINSYKTGFSYGSNGYTIKLLHGFDIALILSILAYMINGNILLAISIFTNLSVHEFWDFIVYPFTWKELFLVTRARSVFKPGIRKYFKGIFFNLSRLKY